MAKFFIETYGCQMNVSESASLKKILLDHDHEEAATETEAQWVILNTCSVRLTAEQRIEGRIGYYRNLNRNQGKNIKLILMGCMGQNVGEDIKKRFPDVVKVVWGTYNKEGILPYLSGTAQGDFLDLEGYHFMPAEPEKQHPYKAFVPISHGCNNFCTYCIVPHVRGREVHRDSREILENIKTLASEGVKEITLLGQNVNSYESGGIHFPELLDMVASETGIPRLSFLTSHPKDFNLDLADVMSAHANIMPYLHLPFQAGSDTILQRMNRKYTRNSYMDKISIARSIPGIVLTTDILVGFPGETEADFQATMEIVKEVRFHEAYMYKYSVRPGTEAEKYTDHVDEDIKLSRLQHLIEVQMKINRASMAAQIGEATTVLMENRSRKDPSHIKGRSHSGMLVVLPGEISDIGSIQSVRITDTSGSMLVGEKIRG